MSKSLGNSPDPLTLIKSYGADGVRVGLLLSSAAGNDLLFDEALCQQGKQFANKIWNAFRLLQGWEVDTTVQQPKSSEVALEWFHAKFQESLLEIEDQFSKYRLSDALMIIYKLIWDDFASWLLEIVKPAYQQPVDAITKKAVTGIFEDLLKILHPFMPFLTEEIWHYIAKRDVKNALIVSTWPVQEFYAQETIREFEFLTMVISNIRAIRKEKQLPFKTPISLSVINNEDISEHYDSIITKLCNLETLEYTEDAVDGALTFRVRSNEYFIPITGTIDLESEIKKINEELKYTQGFLSSVQKKLSNERFVNNAPQQVVDIEKKKEADALAKIETLKSSLASLKN